MRLLIVQHFSVILDKYPDAYLSCMGDFSNASSKLLLDKYPEVKKEMSLLIVKLGKKAPNHFGLNGLTFTKGLIGNLKHQHSKVRTETLKVP